MTNRLAEVYRLGQSPWCDNVARDQIQAGAFQQMIERDAIVGVTSNPSIFQKAMTVGSAYDDQFRDLAAEGLDAQSIYQVMANQDIGDMLDLFRPVYDRTNGVDGYVSLEVSPLLAYETERTIAEARQLWTHLLSGSVCRWKRWSAGSNERLSSSYKAEASSRSAATNWERQRRAFSWPRQSLTSASYTGG